MTNSTPGVPNPATLATVASGALSPIWYAGLNNTSTGNLSVINTANVSTYSYHTPIVLGPGVFGGS